MPMMPIIVVEKTDLAKTDLAYQFRKMAEAWWNLADRIEHGMPVETVLQSAVILARVVEQGLDQVNNTLTDRKARQREEQEARIGTPVDSSLERAPFDPEE